MYKYRSTEPRQCAHCGAEFFPPLSNLAKGNGRYCSKRCGYDSAKRTPAAIRFWRHVQKTESCWLWTGGAARGHGQILGDATPENDRPHVYAHRLSWELHRGPIPEGMEVCHNCPGGDNGLCVNPAHLFLGTSRENAADSVRKGLLPRGERAPHAKLTEPQVIEIRHRYANSSISHEKLAREYGVSTASIRNIILRINWRHVP